MLERTSAVEGIRSPRSHRVEIWHRTCSGSGARWKPASEPMMREATSRA